MVIGREAEEDFFDEIARERRQRGAGARRRRHGRLTRMQMIIIYNKVLYLFRI
jgi:hypothetical protein